VTCIEIKDVCEPGEKKTFDLIFVRVQNHVYALVPLSQLDDQFDCLLKPFLL
jgi:hypothetical protein